MRRYRSSMIAVCLAASAGIAAGQTTAPAPVSSAPPASAPAVPPPAPAVPATPPTSPPQTAQAVTIDGDSFAARPVSVGQAEAVFQTPQGQRKVALRDLWQIRLGDSEDALARRNQKLLLLGAEGMLAFDTLSLKDGKFALEGQGLGKAQVDMSAASVLYLPGRDQTPQSVRKKHAELQLPAVNTDFLVAEDAKGNWTPVPGVLKAIAGGKVTFEFDKADRVTELSSVRIIQLAHVGARPPGRGGELTTQDGSVIPFAAASFDGSAFACTAEGVEASGLGPSQVAEIRFRSDRYVYLSDLKPAKVVEAGTFDVVFGYRADRCATGSPLRLDKAAHAKGLGLHSRCELVYDLDGKYSTFAATCGIDESAGRGGNALLRVLGDGKELCKPVKLVGTSPAVPVRCGLAGVRQLTLVADFGDDGLDVGDLVDLVDARLIKP